jgi:charged multivesicular body protein 3
MGLFGETKKKDPREHVRDMQSKLRKEGYKVDRDINAIQRTVKTHEAEIKKYGQSGNLAAAKIIAKEIVNARKTVSRLYCAKAEMNSVSMSLNHQVAMMKMAGNMQKSTEVMKCMSNLIKVPEIQATMRELSQEMAKAGLLEEMMDDAMESALGDDGPEMEEAAENEVDKVLWEITQGQLGRAPAAVNESLGPTAISKPAAATSSGSRAGPSTAAAVADDGDMDDMAARLHALRS